MLTWQPRISSGPVDKSASTKRDLRSDHGFSANTFLGSAGGDHWWPFLLYRSKSVFAQLFRAIPGGIRLTANVHVYGCDVDLFKKAFFGKTSHVTVPWSGYHGCSIGLIQQTLYIEKIDIHKDIYMHSHTQLSSQYRPGRDHRGRIRRGPRIAFRAFIYLLLFLRRHFISHSPPNLPIHLLWHLFHHPTTIDQLVMSNEKAEKKVLVDGQEPIDEAPKDETKEQANE